MEDWLGQASSMKQKRGGSITSSYHGASMNGPPTSASEDKVCVSVMGSSCGGGDGMQQETCTQGNVAVLIY